MVVSIRSKFVKHGRILQSGLFALLVLLVVGCTNGAKAIDGPVAFQLGTKVVTVKDFEKRLDEELGAGVQRFLAQGQSREEIIQLAKTQDVFKSIFDRMIQEELLFQVAKQEGIGVDSKEIDAALAMQQTQEMSQTAKDKLRVNITRQYLVGAVIAKHTTADMFKSRHILVTDTVSLQEVMAGLQKGEKFADLAKKYSKDPGSASQGGELGWVPAGNFVPEYEQKALTTTTELNKPITVTSQFGTHVIVVEAREKNRPFDDIKLLSQSRNGQTFYETTFLPWYKKLREDAEKRKELKIDPKFDPNTVPLPFPPEAPGKVTPPSSEGSPIIPPEGNPTAVVVPPVENVTVVVVPPTAVPPVENPTAVVLPTAIPPVENPTAVPPVENPTAVPPVENPTAIPPVENPTAIPPVENPTAIPPVENPTAIPPVENPTAVPPTAIPPVENPTAIPPVENPTATNP